MQLGTCPERGPGLDDLAPGLRIVEFKRRVTVAFRVLANAVELVAIASRAGTSQRKSAMTNCEYRKQHHGVVAILAAFACPQRHGPTA